LHVSWLVGAEPGTNPDKRRTAYEIDAPGTP
jgi:hypothetical protein